MGLYNQYNIKKIDNTKVSPQKTISRQIGGMKGQGVTSTTLDVNGQDISVPRLEYVELLELQIKELRNKIQVLEKQLIVTNNRIARTNNALKQDQMSRK